MTASESAGARRLVLVDGTAQLYRAYFAVRGLSTSGGLPTNAIFGFTSMLRKLLAEERPDAIAVAFDVRGPVFRHERFPQYKANRPPTPEDFHVQAPYARRICEVLGVTAVERGGIEADDLIASYARRGRELGFEVVVVASDKDLLQLVGDGVSVLNPSKEIRLDAAAVEDSFGVPPEQVREVLGLMGDSVDNIPGVSGIGEKTALAIVSTYGTIERVIERAGRFVSLYDARDRLLESVAAIEAAEALSADAVAALREATGSFATALETLLAAEPAEAERERLQAVRIALEECDLAVVEAGIGQAGKRAARPLRALKKETKGMDRGSARKSWYAIRDQAERALLSRELATLKDNVVLDPDVDGLALREPDRSEATTLFRELEFQALVAEFEGDVPATPGVARVGAASRRYETILDEPALAALAERIAAAEAVAIHTETDGGDPMQARLIGLSVAWEPGGGAYLPLAHEYLGVPAQLQLDRVRELLGPRLADPVAVRYGHNVKLHDHLLRRHGLPVGGWQTDTMVASFVLDSSRSTYALERLAREFLGLELAGRESVTGSGSKRRRLAEIEIDRVTETAAESADATLRLAVELEERMERAGVATVYREIDHPLLPVLARMEALGIGIDVKLLRTMSGEMESALDKARNEIHRLAGSEFNVDSPKQLREVLFDRMGLKPKRKTAKSKVASTDAQTLEELAGEHIIARSILEYRELSKLKGTYVDALPRLVNPETGRVHTSFQPTGAATGRLSSSDPNLQNIPARKETGRRIRAAFVPAAGHLFLASDYSQVELRVLAHMTGDEELTAAFQAGEDIHRYTAAQVFGVVPDLVTDAMRRSAKAVNFGILYGMSETRLAREQGMKRTDARRFIQAYFERFARVRDYIDEVREQARRDAAVRTLFGRVRPFPQLHQRVHRGIQEQALRGALNTTIQGTAADLMKLAMLRVDDGLRRAGLQARMLLQVHDELLLEVPEGEIEAVAALVREAMEQVHELAVPLVVDQKIGRSWEEVT